MPHVEASVSLPVSPDDAWRRIGSFQSVGDWHPMLREVASEGDRPGAKRVATTVDGQQQVERLLAFDPERHFYRYTMESSPMPVAGYVGEFRVSARDDGASTVHWASDFDVTAEHDDETADMVQQFLSAGVGNLRQQFGRGAASGG